MGGVYLLDQSGCRDRFQLLGFYSEQKLSTWSWRRGVLGAGACTALSVLVDVTEAAAQVPSLCEAVDVVENQVELS